MLRTKVDEFPTPGVRVSGVFDSKAKIREKSGNGAVATPPKNLIKKNSKSLIYGCFDRFLKKSLNFKKKFA